MDEIEILFKEYDAVREEITTGLSSRNTILSTGMAAIGITVTAAVAFTSFNSQIAGLIFLFTVPVVCSFVLFIWFGEYRRVQNAGKFLYNLEKKINSLAGEQELLTFESNTRQNRQDKTYVYDPTVMLLTAISLVSILIGSFTLRVTYNEWIRPTIGIAMGIYVVIVYVRIVYNIGKLRVEI